MKWAEIQPGENMAIVYRVNSFFTVVKAGCAQDVEWMNVDMKLLDSI